MTDFMQIFTVCELLHIIFDYLSIESSINLTITCCDLVEYYPEVFRFFHEKQFPKSLLPTATTYDFLYLRDQMVITNWYRLLYNSCGDMSIILTIEDLESDVKNLDDVDLDIYYELIDNWLTEKQLRIIDNFRYYCLLFSDGQSLCWKGKPDMRLYGLSSENKDDLEKWEDGKKFITYANDPFKVEVTSNGHNDNPDFYNSTDGNKYYIKCLRRKNHNHYIYNDYDPVTNLGFKLAARHKICPKWLVDANISFVEYDKPYHIDHDDYYHEYDYTRYDDEPDYTGGDYYEEFLHTRELVKKYVLPKK